MGIRVNEGSSIAFMVDEESDRDMYIAQTIDGGVGLGTPAIGGAISGVYFPNTNKPEDLNGWVGSLGGAGKIKVLGVALGIGGDLHTNFGKDKNFFARIRLNPSKEIPLFDEEGIKK